MFGENETSQLIQKDILEILKWFDKVCKENGLKYYLAGGTLLGAVRHKGFIPWDDDIDLFMDRDQYDKLLHLNLNDSRYKIFSLENKGDYYYPFIKIIDSKALIKQDYLKHIDGYGLWIDIFPLDKNKLHFFDFIALEINKAKFTGSIYTEFIPPHNGSTFKRILKFLLYRFYHNKNPKIFALKIDKIARKSNKYKCEEKRLWCLHAGKNDCYESKWFDGVVNLRFEDVYLPCPKFYDEFLKRRYGDYMTLPPEKERYSLHQFTFLSNPDEILKR